MYFVCVYIYRSPRRYPYFDVVVGLTWSYDPESYAGGSLAVVESPMPDRSKVMIQTKRDTLALQVGVGSGVDEPRPVKSFKC
jgi:hypothetical protein